MTQNHVLHSTIQSRDGVALITSLAILVVVAALVLGSIITTQVEMAITRNDSTSAQAQYVAQAGLQTYKAALFQTFRWMEGGGSSGTSLDPCTNSLAGGIDFGLGSGDQQYLWINDRIVLPQGVVEDDIGRDIGNFDVTILRDPNNVSVLTVRSVGRTLAGGVGRQATATAAATFVIRNSSTLEQAIFAGAGSDMRFLNGNTTIYGGVHVVGDEFDLDNVVIQSNGNLGIFNGYDKTGISGSLGFLQSAAHRSTNLCASVRVQYGKIAIGGSTQLGKPDQKLLVVAVGRGLEDIVTQQGGTTQCQQNKGVCSETPVGPYDIDVDQAPVFPLLDVDPDTEFCSGQTWRSCIVDEARADGYTLTAVGSAAVVSGAPQGLELAATCQLFLDTAASTQNRVLSFDGTRVDCTWTDPVTGRITGFDYNPAATPASFNVFGNVNLEGFDVHFQRAVQYEAISRVRSTGMTQNFANFAVQHSGGTGGNFRANRSFTTKASNPFPGNVLSIVAERDVDLRGGNGSYFSAPIYAGDTFRMTSQSILFGQVISNSFCTTNPGNVDTVSCSSAGTPNEIVFVPTGSNRAESFRAIAPSTLPTFTTVTYELR